MSWRAIGCAVGFVTALLPGLHASAGAVGTGALACSEAELRKLVLDRPKDLDVQRRRSEALAAGLACPDILEYRPVAAAAAYELSLFHAGATGLKPPDWRLAVEFAKRSAGLLQPTTDQRLWFKTSLVVARLQMYGARDLPALADARKTLEDLSTQPADAVWLAGLWPDYFELLADINERMFRQGEPTARVAAIEAIDRYLATEPGLRRTADRASALEMRGKLLVALGYGVGSEMAGDLDRAVSAFQEAIDIQRALGNKVERLRLQVNLAMAFVHVEGPRYGANVERAIEILKPALTEIDPHQDPEVFVEATNGLGSAFMARQEGERNLNLLEAVRWFRAGRGRLDKADPDMQASWVRASVNLALALESIKISQEKHLKEADGILNEVVAWLEQRKRFEDTVKPLAIQFDIRLTWASWGDREHLDEAGKLLAKAEQRAVNLSAERRAQLMADRGDYLRARFVAGDAAALDQAVAAYRGALALVGPASAPSMWASMQNNLGNACNTRSRPDLYDCALEGYQQALRVRTEQAMPREHADTLVNLANLEFERGHWQRSAELYALLARRHRSMFETIEQQTVLLRSASQSKRWFERAAYALARQGQAEEGLWIAEQGKVRLLKRRLGLKDVVPGELAESGGLDRISAPIGTLVLLPIVSTKGALVFALFRSEQGWRLRTFFLDGLSADEVVAFMQGRVEVEGPGGWLGAYRQVVEQGVSHEPARQALITELRNSQAWLGQRLVQPVFASLQSEGIVPKFVAWITQGELAVLPIHAALMTDGRPLLEHVPVMYAPSLLLLRSSAVAAGHRPRKALRLVTVGNPTNDPTLLFAEAEARSAASRLPPSKSMVLVGARATGASIKQALKSAQIFHFAGHASFSREDPQKSHLVLAGDQRLTVADLQAAVSAEGPELAILSACESGMIQISDIANEFQGLPAAFLGLGTKGVLSSLWPVDDGPTLFLIDHLMAQTLLSERPLPQALREAQLWLRDVRGEELAQVARRLAGLVKPGETKAQLEKLAWIFERKPQWQPYADPIQWAGFFFSGRDLRGLDKGF